MKQLNIKSIPNTQRPYEKCEKFGVSALSDSELIAVILRSGSKDNDVLSLSNDVLKLCDEGKNISRLLNLSEADLRTIHGIGKVKARQLVCIGELTKRIALSKAEKNLSFSRAETVADYYMEKLRYLQQEHFVLCMLDAKNRLIKDKVISIGTVTSTVISPRDIFKEALKHNAVRIIVLHNHPSGDPAPSPEDIEVTNRLVKIGELLSLPVLDHIIIGDKEYCSFKEKGIIA